MNKYQQAFDFIFGYALDGALNVDEHCKVREYAKIVQEAIDKAIEYNNKNTTLKATNVRSTWDEDNDYLIGTCPICNHTNEVLTVWATDTTQKCSYCGQELLFSLRSK